MGVLPRFVHHPDAAVKVLAYAAVNHTKFLLGGESAGMKDRSNQASEQPTMNVQEILARINALWG